METFPNRVRIGHFKEMPFRSASCSAVEALKGTADKNPEPAAVMFGNQRSSETQKEINNFCSFKDSF